MADRQTDRRTKQKYILKQIDGDTKNLRRGSDLYMQNEIEVSSRKDEGTVSAHWPDLQEELKRYKF